MKQCNSQTMRKHNIRSDVSQCNNILRYVYSDNSGVAMIVVLIVGVVVMAFCLSLLLVTYTLFSQTSRQTTQLQCKILAQSASETLGEELKNPDSALSVYLSNQIAGGYWISEDVNNSPEDGSLNAGRVSELVLNLDAGGTLGDYNLSITLTYSLNVVDDDDEGGGDDEDDDQDNDLSGDSSGDGVPPQEGQDGSGAIPQNSSNSSDTPPGNGTYYIKASIKCMRGDGTDSDVQFYIIETVYPAVGL